MSFFKYTLLAVVVASLVVISGCDNDDEEPAPTQTVWELVQENSDLTMLEAMLTEAGLDDELSGDGPFTLFAPSDQAMNTLLTTLGLTDFSSINPAIIESVLKYHILQSQKLYAELSGDLQTMQGENITVTGTGDDKLLDTGATSDAELTTRDIKGTNGVIHIISTVIVPPTIGDLLVKTLGTVAQPLLLGKDFSTLSVVIQMAEGFALANQQTPLLGEIDDPGILIGDDILTVFAIPNTVFTTAGITPADFTGQQWYGILLNHIVMGDYHEDGDYTVGVGIPTLAGGALTPLTKSAPPSPPTINTGIALDSNGDTTAEGQIAVLDVLAALGLSPANNGYVNVIAGVLSPQ